MRSVIPLLRSTVEKLGLRTIVSGAIALVVAVVAVVVLVDQLGGGDRYRITARFVATPGLYADNSVDILGIPTGKIESVTPKDNYVEVVMSLPTSVKVPADAKAVMMAPNPVSDRFVELTPAYTDGARMPDGATIGLDRTIVPLELDSIYSSVQDLSRELGPGGANNKGQVSAVLSAFAKLADGNGADLHQAIDKISAALPALTRNPDQLKRLVTGLDSLTSKIVARNSTVNALYDDLATVTGQLADERQSISAAISNLQTGLARTADFIKTNRSHITGSVKNLDTALAAVLREQKALIQTFDIAPLGFQNFNRAIDPNAPCVSPTGAPNNCAALHARADLTSNASDLVTQYCGDSVLNALVPILLKTASVGNATATHTACGALIGLVNKRTGPPGSPSTPDLDLTHYLGSR